MSEPNDAYSDAVLHQNPNDEEDITSYVTGGFHPVQINEIFDNKYIMVRKLGWGRYSTVWLVQDFYTSSVSSSSTPAIHFKSMNSAEKKYAMKILSSQCYGTSGGSGTSELEILQKFQHWGGGDRNHHGYEHISILHESFVHKGPNGEHVCLVFKVM
jgi:serine/threonine-protein kinase SRPK3